MRPELYQKSLHFEIMGIWTILSVDHKGQEKHPCCIGSSDDHNLNPTEKNVVLDAYSIMSGYGIKGKNLEKKYFF